MTWSKRLDRPVVTPEGKEIVTLSDARDYAVALPKSRHMDPHVQAGVEVIIMAAEDRGPIHTAQSGVAHIVHGPKQPLNLGKPDQPWLKQKPKS